MISVSGIIIIVALIICIISKVADIAIGSIFVIGGVIYNAYINSSAATDLRMEAFFNDGVTDLTGPGYITIAIGAIIIVIGVVRFIVSNNKKKKNLEDKTNIKEDLEDKSKKKI